MEFNPEPPADAAVAQGLAALKREGGSVLVVGGSPDAQGDVCRRFLGEDDDRMYVDTDGLVRPGDVAAADTVIDRPVRTRSTAATTGGQPDASSLLAEVGSTIRATADEAGTLRVCVDSLRPFVDVTDTPGLVSAMEAVNDAARDVGAVVHYHLPADPEAVPDALFGAVDAVAEVEHRNGTARQRWRFPGATEPSEWVEI